VRHIGDPMPGAKIVNTTSRASSRWERSLSPFFLGPCDLYDDFHAVLVENAWQFSKLYPVHADKNGEPTKYHWDWAKRGYASVRAHRYPMGRRARPLCSLWEGERLGYVEARKRIYVPLYAEAVIKTDGWLRLYRSFRGGGTICLLDFDAYDYGAEELTLKQVLNDPERKMGHAFVLAMLLLDDDALEETDFR
jgi:hypothetical protein